MCWKEAGWSKLSREELGPVQLPIWLRLARNHEKEKMVIAWRSQDGLTWQRAGQVKLNTRVEPWPPGSDHNKPVLYAGVGLTGPGGEEMATARFAEYTVTAKGLLGEYYADDHFKNLKFTRPDTKLEMNWDRKSPSPEIQPERFSARWTGLLEPKYSENYRFYLDGNDQTQIWVDGRPIPRVSRNPKSNAYGGQEVPLRAGERCALRIDFVKTDKPSALKLSWSSRSQNLEIIPAHQLSYTYSSATPLDEVVTNTLVPKGVWLRNGGFVAGDFLASDSSSSQIAWSGQRRMTLFNQKIAHVLFRTSRRPIPWELADNKTGVFLGNGDFLECEFDSLRDRTLRVTSVLFGLKSFNLDNPEILALVLNKVVPDTAATEISLIDGTLLKVKSLRPSGSNWLVHDLTLGELTIPQNEIAELRSAQAMVASRSDQ